ncbi:hypothetical protein GQX74_006198 [Glossina fuscipes]|nr:hypothetical protein GQX74_006198 [Glossina fuscipes]
MKWKGGGDVAYCTLSYFMHNLLGSKKCQAYNSYSTESRKERQNKEPTNRCTHLSTEQDKRELVDPHLTSTVAYTTIQFITINVFVWYVVVCVMFPLDCFGAVDIWRQAVSHNNKQHKITMKIKTKTKKAREREKEKNNL